MSRARCFNQTISYPLFSATFAYIVQGLMSSVNIRYIEPTSSVIFNTSHKTSCSQPGRSNLGTATFFLFRPAAGRGDAVAALLAAFTAAANTEGGVGRGRGFVLEIPGAGLWDCDEEGTDGDPVGVGVFPPGAGDEGGNAGPCSLARRFKRI